MTSIEMLISIYGCCTVARVVLRTRVRPYLSSVVIMEYQDISRWSRPGHMKTGQWVAGFVVSSREITVDLDKGKGKNGRKSRKSDGYEVHICSGRTLGDVVLVQAWPSQLVQLLRYSAPFGAAVKITGVTFYMHSGTTRYYSTSQHKLFMKLDYTAMIRSIEGSAKWLRYHPLTELHDLRRCQQDQLVCVTGRVIGAPSVTKSMYVAGKQRQVVDVTIRHGHVLVQISFWSPYTEAASGLKAGGEYMFQAVRVHHKKLNTVLLCQRSSRVGPSPMKLSTTPYSKVDSTNLTAASLERQEYIDSHLEWSVCSQWQSNEHHSMPSVCRIASVFITLVTPDIAYAECRQCRRAVSGVDRQCSCGAMGIASWRCRVILTDHSGQMEATIFGAFSDIATVVNDDPSVHATFLRPSDYLDGRACEMLWRLAAIPCTVVLEAEDDGSEERNIIVRQIARTCQRDGSRVLHPGQSLQCASSHSRDAVVAVRMSDSGTKHSQ